MSDPNEKIDDAVDASATQTPLSFPTSFSSLPATSSYSSGSLIPDKDKNNKMAENFAKGSKARSISTRSFASFLPSIPGLPKKKKHDKSKNSDPSSASSSPRSSPPLGGIPTSASSTSLSSLSLPLPPDNKRKRRSVIGTSDSPRSSPSSDSSEPPSPSNSSASVAASAPSSAHGSDDSVDATFQRKKKAGAAPFMAQQTPLSSASVPSVVATTSASGSLRSSGAKAEFDQWIKGLQAKNPDELEEEYIDDEDFDDSSSGTSSSQQGSFDSNSRSGSLENVTDPFSSTDDKSRLGTTIRRDSLEARRESFLKKYGSDFQTNSHTDGSSCSDDDFDGDSEDTLSFGTEPGSTKPTRKYKSFYKRFKRLPNEEVIRDYLCALLLKGTLLAQGSMYITTNYVCFYANIFGNKSRVSIHFKDIISVEKAKILRSIPNSIEICTNEKKYFWASFVHRDKAFNLITKRWRTFKNLGNELPDFNSTPPSPASVSLPPSPRDNVDPSVAPSTAPVTSSSAEELSKTDRPSRSFSSFSSFGADITRALNLKEHRRGSAMPSSSSSSTPVVVATHTSSSSSSSSSHGTPTLVGMAAGSSSSLTVPISLSGTNNEDEGFEAKMPPMSQCEHQINMVAKAQYAEKFPITVKEFYQNFISNNGNQFWEELHSTDDYSGFSASEWVSSGEGCCLTRQVEFKAPIRMALATKYTRVTQQQRCFMESEDRLVFENSSFSRDVPYSNTFYVQSKWYVTTDEADASCCNLKIGVQLHFSKKVWIKGIIEHNAIDGSKEWFENWIKAALSTSKIIRQDSLAPKGLQTPKRDLLRQSLSRAQIIRATSEVPSLSSPLNASSPLSSSSHRRSLGASGGHASHHDGDNIDDSNQEPDTIFSHVYRVSRLLQLQISTRMFMTAVTLIAICLLVLSMTTLYFFVQSTRLSYYNSELELQNQQLVEQEQFLRFVIAKAAGKKPIDASVEHWRFWKTDGELNSLLDKWKKSLAQVSSLSSELSQQLHSFALPKPSADSSFFAEVEQALLSLRTNRDKALSQIASPSPSPVPVPPL